MSVIIWDAGEGAKERYTISVGSKAIVVGDDAVEDFRNINPIPGVDVKWMDAHYKRIPVNEIPVPIAKAVQEYLKRNS